MHIVPTCPSTRSTLAYLTRYIALIQMARNAIVGMMSYEGVSLFERETQDPTHRLRALKPLGRKRESCVGGESSGGSKKKIPKAASYIIIDVIRLPVAKKVWILIRHASEFATFFYNLSVTAIPDSNIPAELLVRSISENFPTSPAQPRA